MYTTLIMLAYHHNYIDKVKRSQLQERLNEINYQGIVGVEYIIEVYVGEKLFG